MDDLLSQQADTLYEQSIEDQEKSLDELLENSEKQASDYLKNSEVVFVDALNKVNANTGIISKNLKKISSDLGYDISSNITNAWKDGCNAVDTYESILQGNVPNITTQIGLITSAWNEACEAAEKTAKAMVDATTDNYLEHTTIGADSNNNNGNNGNSNNNSNNISNNNNSSDNKNNNSSETKNNNNSSETKKDNITTILENGSNKNPTSELAKAVRSAYGEGLTKGEMYQISSILKLGYKKEDFYDDSSIRNKAKNDVLQALIKKGYLKKSGKSYLRGYSKGGVISELSDAIRFNGDTVLVSAKPGERMLTEQQNGYWEKWTQSLPNLMNLTDIIKPNVNIPTAIPTANREQSPVYNIDINTTVEGVATNEIVKDMANVAKKQAENVISEINRRTYAKGVRWK